MLGIDTLTVTHNELRSGLAVHAMATYVRDGGVYDKAALARYARTCLLEGPSPSIQIARFEDGRLFIHDGHHRVVSCLLGGRHVLYDEEFEIAECVYEKYMTFCLEKGWYTPFDPRTQVRVPDLTAFKSEVMRRYARDEPPARIIEWILRNSHLYQEPRRIRSVSELAHAVIVSSRS
jgi:hypothetical protein